MKSKMKSKMLAGLFCMASFNVVASDFDEWRVQQSEDGALRGYTNSSWLREVTINSDMSIFIFNPNLHCEDEEVEVIAYNVERRLVNFNVSCISDDTVMRDPTTEKGRDFIRNKFIVNGRKKASPHDTGNPAYGVNSVRIAEFSFTAVGYEKVVNSLKTVKPL